jgi:hypothetical protein
MVKIDEMVNNEGERVRVIGSVSGREGVRDWGYDEDVGVSEVKEGRGLGGRGRGRGRVASMAGMAEMDVVKANERLRFLENVEHLKHYVWRKKNPEETKE